MADLLLLISFTGLTQSAFLPSAERYFLAYGARILARSAKIRAQMMVKYQSDHRRRNSLPGGPPRKSYQ